MEAIFILLLICSTKVYTSSSLDEKTSEISLIRVWDIEELEALEKSLYTHVYENFVDGPPPLSFPESEFNCHKDHVKCLKKIKSKEIKPVCAYQKKYGLVKFQRDCDVYFENCLMQSYEKRTGKKSLNDLFYYNYKGKECQYYVDQTYSIEDAIAIYKLHAELP